MILRRDWLIGGAAVAVAAIGLTACSSRTEAKPANASTVQAAQTVVPVAQVRRANMASRTVLTAEFQPFQEVDVMAKVAGYLRSIKVDLGDRVREGQVLGELEIPEMNDEISKAAAMVEQTSSEIAAAKDELRRVESAHEIAHLSHARLEAVAKREPGLIPQQEVDEVKARDLVAEAQLSAARSKLQVEQNKVQVARAEVTRLRTMKNYVTITAPFTGTVTKRYANTGAMIQAGISSQSQAMPLVRLSQISTLRLSLPVPESLVPGIRVGQLAEVQVKSLGRTFEGRVARLASKVDAATRTMTTEVDVPNPNGVILPGMYAEVAVQTTKHDNVLTVPLDAIERGTAARVWTVDAAGTINAVPVELGIEDAHRVEIVSGINDRDMVIIGRRTGLKPGDKAVPKVIEPEQ
ncbi:MAG: efflux RND transporter periplasmic adaptor subunit [Bryobacterales bacterium]|nr:efflux RND transporter periplasmic adaptor subunit [Bryobacterales bacterium]